MQGIWPRRGLATAILCLVMVAAVASQSRVTETQRQLRDLRSRIHDLENRLDAQLSRRSKVQERIETLDRAVSQAAGKVHRTARKQSETLGEIASLKDKSDRLKGRLAAQKQHVARLVYSTYVMGRQSRLKLFLNQRDPAVIDRMLGYHDYIVAARARAIDRINDWESKVAALTARENARRSELAALENRYRSEQNELETRRAARRKALAAVNSKIASSQDELSQLKGNEARLENVLKKLEALLKEQRSHRLAAGAFRSMKGKLPLPVSAPISARFGERRSTGIPWNGVMFRPAAGAPVRAIFDGRVVFADWLRGFGLLLIIDHGGGYMSLYSHNESLYKRVGDWVRTGEVIATVGTSGGLEKPGLYFEIRHDGKPQNPLSWCQTA